MTVDRWDDLAGYIFLKKRGLCLSFPPYTPVSSKNEHPRDASWVEPKNTKSRDENVPHGFAGDGLVDLLLSLDCNVREGAHGGPSC